jgi:DNA-binding transcriptional ArsR family regulator
MSFEDEARKALDARAIRALAHPLRIRILDLLDERQPLTATELSELVGESPANCSFHLRTLAKYGFVEEAGGGTGRNRPWQRPAGSIFIDDTDADSDTRNAARAFHAVKREAAMRRVAEWEERRHSYPGEWRKVGFSQEINTALTAAELKEVGEKLFELVIGIHESRETPPDAERVAFYAWGFPLGRPKGES